MEAVARRFNQNPFSDDFLRTWGSPYRRAFLIQSLSIDTEEQIKIKLLSNDLPEYLRILIDALGTNLINVSGRTMKNPIKSMFGKLSKKKDGVSSLNTGIGNIVTLPDGRKIKMGK
jgi:hypothetical protein